MMRAIHGAPAEALRQALEALAQLSFWISWTSDPDLAPEPVVSARCMRDGRKALRKAARLSTSRPTGRPPPTPPGGARPVSGSPRRNASGGGRRANAPPTPEIRSNSSPRRSRARPGRARAGRRGPFPARPLIHRRRFA